MADLTEEALEKIMLEVCQRDEKICIRPTKLYIPRYEGETDEEYAGRVEKAKEIVRRLT
jgi:hypothetical protein